MDTTNKTYNETVDSTIPNNPKADYWGSMNFNQLGLGINSFQNNDVGQGISQIGAGMPGFIGAGFQAFGALDSLLSPLVKLKKLENPGLLNNTSSFGGSQLQVQKAADKLADTQKKGLIGRLFAKKKTNKSTNLANEQINLTNDVLSQGLKDTQTAQQAENTLINQQSNILSGNKTPNFLFKNGGTLGELENPNIIPDGKLHAHKHNLKENIDYLQEIPMSTKGIPVLAVAEDGTFQQHAEIEKGELILTPEVTKELLALYEENTKEAKIKAGKILTEQLLKNTKDNTEILI